MARPKDDDLAFIDPFVQSFRKSHIQILRKYLTSSSWIFDQSLTEDEKKAFSQVLSILKVPDGAVVR